MTGAQTKLYGEIVSWVIENNKIFQHTFETEQAATNCKDTLSLMHLQRTEWTQVSFVTKGNVLSIVPKILTGSDIGLARTFASYKNSAREGKL